MSNLLRSYTKIYGLQHELESDNNFLNQVRLPSLSFKIEEFRQKISHRISPFSEHHLIDSMPVEICKVGRANRSKICRDTIEQSPNHGYCAAQKAHYLRYKLHAVYTASGVFKTFDITKTSTHDIQYLNDVKAQFSNCVLIGDRGYLSHRYQQDLFENNSIRLTTPARKNQLNPKPFSRSFSKARKRIETLFSQLCDRFMIRRNYAKSFTGFAARMISKITALTVIQWINKRSGNSINNLKIAIS